MKFILLYLIIINAVSFVLMLEDKSFARNHRRRIPERTLVGAALLGGSIGALLGMYIFHHKTRHLKFTIGVPAILIAQLLLYFWIF